MIVTIDVVLMTVLENALKVAVVNRDRSPFEGKLALPGGFVHDNEDLSPEDAARRVLTTKLGVTTPYLEQLYTFAGSTRDPRGWSVSIVYFALIPAEVLENTGKYQWLDVAHAHQLAFDHALLVEKARERVKAKATYTDIPAYFLPSEFSLTALQKMYELLLETKLDKSSFRRKLAELDVLDETTSKQLGAHRPAKLYRLKHKDLAVFNRYI